MNDEEKIPFTAHLEELRKRLITCFIAVGIGFVLAYSVKEWLFHLLTMREYLSFSSLFLLVFGLVFELPLVLVFLVKLGIVSIEFLTKNRKYAILVIFILAAILSPPDVVSLTLMAIPMMALYEIGILGTRIFVRKKPQDQDMVKK